MSPSVHEVGRAAAQLHVFLPLERELDPREPDQNQVESVEDEDEEEDPEAAVVALRVRLENKVLLPEVGDELREVVDLHLGGKQDQNQAAGRTCRTNTGSCSEPEPEPEPVWGRSWTSQNQFDVSDWRCTDMKLWANIDI